MIVGMDFGTTNSGIAAYDGDVLRLIPLDPSNRNPAVARTALYITNDNEVFLGRGATDKYYEQNLNRPFKLERVRVGEIELTFAEIGTFITDVFIEKDIYAPGRLFLSFKMGLSNPDYLGTVVGDQYYYLEDIITVYLYLTRRRAEQHLQRDIDTIVLGRPVRYSDADDHNAMAQERMLQAAFRAGYKTVYLQYEPIAAAYAYEQTIQKEENVLVFDFGGGTLDISIMRLGNPKTRAVLATGGIPIAGDVFDRKIVRAKFPAHFGEGTTYNHVNGDLPVPSAYYTAFESWQELLRLQMPDKLNNLKLIAQSAKKPRKLDALINMITSNYGLKMYDVAEAAKRQLSDKPIALFQLEGTGFSVHDSLSRIEFQGLIRSDVRAIAERLDDVIRQAGLQHDEIDAVIRTGGSSQIPLFIEILNERFGSDKVRDIDAFSSVTSGLGIIAREIEQGLSDLKAHHCTDYAPFDYLQKPDQGGIPTLDITLMKRFIDVREERARSVVKHHAIVCQDSNRRIQTTAVEINPDDAYPIGRKIDLYPPVLIAPADQTLIIMTTDYRLINKSAQQLADYVTIGTSLEETEDFHEDAFGRETVCAITPIDTLANADRVVFVTTRGYGRALIGDAFLEKLRQPVPYKFARMKGFPLGLIPLQGDSDLLLLSHSGRIVRLPSDMLDTLEHRLIKTGTDGTVIAGLSAKPMDEIIVAAAAGYGKRIRVADIPQTREFNDSGTKAIGRTEPIAMLRCQPNLPIYAITNHRIEAIDPTTLPVEDLPTAGEKIIRLKKGERLLSLAYSY